MTTALQHCTLDDATDFILNFVGNAKSYDTPVSGPAPFLNVIISYYLHETKGRTLRQEDNRGEITNHYPIFADAAWDLCRRGVLRYSSGDDTGYTLTKMGQEWVAKRATLPTFPSDPSRFGDFIQQFKERLGEGFYQRAQEALTCYRFGAYLAACAMSGAAGESILLSLAIAKANGEEDKILSDYRSAGGKQKIENSITQPLKKHLSDPFKDLTGLITYWRNEAAHGEGSEISETEAYIAIAKLLRFADFANRHWDQLTQPSSNPITN